MEKDNVMLSLPNQRLPHDNSNSIMSCRSQYGIPDGYNPADHPPVKMRNHTNADMSETQRKRRSKNRLSNRRSTGYISQDAVEEAIKMGANGDKATSENEQRRD